MDHTGPGAGLLAAVLVSGLGACGRGSVPPGARGEPDSLTTVRTAVSALQERPGHAGPYQVVSFRRDTAGVVVGLQRQGAVLRDGALVRVPRSGAAVIEQIWP